MVLTLVGKPAVGDKVRVKQGAYEGDPWCMATVTDLLSAQFMGETSEGRVVFGVYSSEGDGWKRDW